MTVAEPAAKRVSRLTNEVIFFVRESEWNRELVEVLRMGGTSQIQVDRVKDYRTPFGTYMVIAQLTVTRVRPQTWDLRDYVCRLLNRCGLDIEMSEILAPARAKFYRVS